MYFTDISYNDTVSELLSQSEYAKSCNQIGNLEFVMKMLQKIK